MILVEIVVAFTIFAAIFVVAVAVAAVAKRTDVADLIIVAGLCTRYADMKCSNKTTKQNNYANYALLLFNCNLKNVVAS